MKVGDLVLCTFQPTTSHIDPKTERAMPMKHTIKGDYCLANLDEIKLFMNGDRFGRIQR